MKHVATFTDGNGRAWEATLTIDLDKLVLEMARKARRAGRPRAYIADGAVGVELAPIGFPPA